MRHEFDSPAAVIDRVAGLLDEFHAGGHLTLSELSERTGVPRSSVHRLLNQLIEAGWVRREGRRYALGRSMFEWGALAQHHDELHRAAHNVLHELHSATGLVAHLAVLEGHEVRYLDKVGCETVPLPSRVGGRQPAYRTALGKALLAHTHLSPSTPALPGADSTRLRGEIAQVRERHVAQEREETVRGVACVAAPIGDGRTCSGALSVTGAVDTVDVVSLATPVRVAARAVWRALSHNHKGFQRTSA
ncbi:IclR family transcriptional regulator [Rhodococcus sp. HNM0563]|uniref:IclR family transcriptional regulator n=1 Tax=Rhodococcus sp. HNM0563 TaxID=2716339 RepID=UPI00146AAC0E|nr:IclR family transcriptional regulator [Rhodococcus sp. HNM0563]NLU61767.1 IclR family transcriptional regulator [Rhodococcus sp. HNM0563]